MTLSVQLLLLTFDKSTRSLYLCQLIRVCVCVCVCVLHRSQSKSGVPVVVLPHSQTFELAATRWANQREATRRADREAKVKTRESQPKTQASTSTNTRKTNAQGSGKTNKTNAQAKESKTKTPPTILIAPSDYVPGMCVYD